MKKTKWGIIGLGTIAKSFADALEGLEEAELYAVASRSQQKADSFGDDYNVTKRYGNYVDLAKDPDVDVVYIATPHNYHKDNSIMCMKEGKGVLCEKPIAINEVELNEMIRMAKENKVFLMEAMWTRFLPLMKEVNKWINEGLIGDVRLISGDFGSPGPKDSEGRLLNPKLAGGALLDLGIYSITLATMFFKEQPNNILSTVNMSNTGVDEEENFIFEYANGKVARLSASFKVYAEEGVIIGTEGLIRIPHFYRATTAFFEKNYKGDQKKLEIPHKTNGYEYEAIEVMDCINKGKLESEIMPLSESIKIMRIMDGIRKEWGFRYPNEA
ncbi:MAG: Gfo/Idh/MocA family protein [Eubacteriales bacterium]